jgi:hypothetical protein
LVQFAKTGDEDPHVYAAPIYNRTIAIAHRVALVVAAILHGDQARVEKAGQHTAYATGRTTDLEAELLVGLEDDRAAGFVEGLGWCGVDQRDQKMAFGRADQSGACQVLGKHGKGHSWTIERLRRAVHRLVRERIAEPALIKRSPRRAPEDRLMTLVAGIAIADPELTLRDIAAQLERMHERTPRGGRQWQASSVKALLDRGRRLGLVAPDPGLGAEQG